MILKFKSLFSMMKASNYVLITSIINTIFFNLVLFSFVVENTDVFSASGVVILLSVFLIAFTFTFASIVTLISPTLLKLFLSVTTIINAVAIYYMANYQVVLDRTMMGNIFNTEYSESSELITFNLLLLIGFIGLIPAYFYIKLKISRVDRVKVAINGVIGLTISIVILYINASSWLWIDKYASLLGGKILPWSYIINTNRYYASLNNSTDGQMRLPDGQFSHTKKMVFVLVIGETARSNNFSLYGYHRETNPKLQQTPNLLAFKNTKSCTTYTTGSLACMLSHTENVTNFEALPTYLARQGADVVWRTNNWGEPAIDVSSYVKGSDLRSSCQGEGCKLDEVLLTNLIETIESSTKQKILIILHTKGSHGPSYYSRYTAGFNQFKPVCREEEISKCTSQELINAYDNTILYTDHFLATLIAKLKSLQSIPSAMMYISDHGESLGEQGLYLHGTPYSFAPDYQKNIPFLFWASDSMQSHKKLNLELLQQAERHTHFNVFHTVLGAFDFQSPIYRKDLDVLSTIISPIQSE
ncbi:phosphoethanolamine--lipid A transferase EptA [Paraglaciecola aquimarina]|uniref:Phosphoethanolamine--lipid A transferase EptA n=1 Tax=Paraglaciecola algarum TaxID=3050085 RepID=A0ABS9DCQ0_9ALTE|nr:phosphoethanolamine--lipid A transferase EptA [Paraglaciecola sp. G1-23]MCF2949569.1 phosphoethanolamine--lipid A transferase EptA [Paraglaciecola sp. G1-23]